MNELFELEAQPRELHGTSANRRMRRIEGMIPAVIYGAKKEATSISLSHNFVKRALENEAFFSHILTIDVAGKKEKVVVKDIQRHPYKPVILHMDFLRINAKEKLQMNVPLHFINEDQAPGAKEGGVITHHLTEVEISCLPSNLPEFIEVDLANLEMGAAIHLTELKLPKGLELIALQAEEVQNHSVVSIHKPKVAAEASADAGEAAADASESAEGEENEG